MYPVEAIEIHHELWDTHDNHVTYRGVQKTITRLNKPTKKFAFVNVNPSLRLVTQNLAKPSENTNWCRTAENGKITWIFKHNKYSGKVVSYTKNGTFINQVYKLNPQEKIFEART